MSASELPNSVDLANEPDFRLGNLQVRPSSREIVGEREREVLEPRVMQVMVTLARRRGQVVSRDHLIKECWRGRVVGEDAINRCIAKVRRLSEIHAGFAIETITRVGYRLTEDAPTERTDAELAPPPSTQPLQLTAHAANNEIPDATRNGTLNATTSNVAGLSESSSRGRLGGYRFVADVTLGAIDDAAQAVAAEQKVGDRSAWPRRRILVASLAAAIVILAGLSFFLMRTPAEPQRNASIVAPAPAVAVLPFVDMSEEQNQTYFADGLSEEILNLLAQSTAMRVIARTSSFSFKDRPELDIATIAHRLDATHVLEGSVRKSGEHIRITAQLVDGATSAHLWSQTYDRDVTDIFTVQDDIAAAVAAALNATLSDGDQPQRADTTSAQAFERYLHGRYFFNRGGESDVTRAREYFEQALQGDPDYARAWAGLAGTYNATLGSGQAAVQDEQRAWLASIERALVLGPGLAEAHVRAAQYYWWLGDWGTSEDHCKLAIALNPSDSLVLSVSANKAMAVGHRLEALSLQRRAVAVDPLSAQGRANLGLYLAAVDELEEAEAELRHARELSPMLPRIDVSIARVLVKRQRFDEALAMVEQMPVDPLREQGLALAFYGLGKVSAADAALARLTALTELPNANRLLKIYVAEVHAFRGNADRALELIESALGPVATRPTTADTIFASQAIHRSPFLMPLRNHARWKSLLPEQASIAKSTAG
jgi:TolB-like protein/DNA-binding winged helix-turn-helix (wHTH) protein